MIYSEDIGTESRLNKPSGYFEFLRTIGREVDGTPLQYYCLENPMDGGAGRLQSTGSLRVGHD